MSQENSILNSRIPTETSQPFNTRTRPSTEDYDAIKAKKFKADSPLVEKNSSCVDKLSKIQKRREKLELWKKLKTSNQISSTHTENNIKTGSSQTDSSNVENEKTKSRRLKIAEFMKNKKNNFSSITSNPLSIESSTNDDIAFSSTNSTQTIKNQTFFKSSENNMSQSNTSTFHNKSVLSSTTKASDRQNLTVLKFQTSFKPPNKINGVKLGFQFSKFNNLAKKKNNVDFENLDKKKAFDFDTTEKILEKKFVPLILDQDHSPSLEKPVNNDDIDPLDEYMENINNSESKNNTSMGTSASFSFDQDDPNSILQAQKNASVSLSAEMEDDIFDESKDILELAAKRLKKKDFITVDHSKVVYEPFKKDFYIEPYELSSMTQDETDALRCQLDDIKIRGQNPPNPVIKWTYFGLPATCVQIIKKLGFESPTPIQSQSIPAILQGRDLIGVAKTGSGKTLAFVLPMLRHIKAQKALKPMEGPIAMIMTPTRELAVQIAKECRLFAKQLNLRTVCSYGGSPIKDQIGELKRGAEIVVCTPGRMIDLLSANSGRVTNLKRVTFLVLDEADRMFDMGFEPQVMKIIQNVRPDRQTLLFSATFPRQMEALARKVLKRPLEITVGGRSVVCSDITQMIEVVDFDEKFYRLLEILGSSLNDDPNTCALIFVERQESADTLFKDLLRRGYMCNSLHGGKDQLDRDQTILDFKQEVFNILIATSVAARGLDVKRLSLVVNYDCPNHLEDYVHRVGRTGRAGNKGTAITFVTSDQGRYAIEIIKALQSSGVDVPRPLQDLADSFLESVKSGEVKYYNANVSGGFGGKGLEKLDQERQTVKNIQRFTFGVEDDNDSEEDIDESGELVKVKEMGLRTDDSISKNRLGKTNNDTFVEVSKETTDKTIKDAIKAAQKAADRMNLGATPVKVGNPGIVTAIDEINAKFGMGTGSQAISVNTDLHSAEFFAEIEINDYPQKARWKVTNRETLSHITEATGTAITVRGVFYQPGKPSGSSVGSNNLITASGEKSRNNEMGLERAKAEIKRILTEATMQSIEQESRQGVSGGQQYSRYSVL
ncbi:hypothetical protein BB561_000555 [Smittium simulii]|uniref:RNA helicase n=1 Tax=Smittium simulii TaxID=133385 RepID=A0A2T9YYR7_9FUNG|nr:hypothetical protein BB561_000555 [Smittium simulii]